MSLQVSREAPRSQGCRHRARRAYGRRRLTNPTVPARDCEEVLDAQLGRGGGGSPSPLLYYSVEILTRPSFIHPTGLSAGQMLSVKPRDGLHDTHSSPSVTGRH